MSTGEERRARLDALFSAALDLAEADRPGFVKSLAANDSSLAGELEELLRLAASPAAGLAAGALSDSLLWSELAGADDDPGAEPTDRVGVWRLISELGSGGMGTVWLAERVDGQFEQQAAVKLLQRGPLAHDLVRQFERERQILARVDHPHIARLLDGGVAADGRPWFAMEYVDGEPIDAYCNGRSLPIEARLRLFVQVARAVEAAHGRLIVHRDLKPSNILVTHEGSPRLLDFGIAKPLDAEPDPEAPARTALLLTPEYASPEQVRGEPPGVTSDVYQLGLLLYELLTGTRAQRLGRLAAAELERVVCERQPPPPSQAVTREGGRRALRGDLDAIVMKALRKEPARRYGSVGGFIDDIERHLSGLPVRARPETLLYRMGKALQRNPVTIGGSVVLVLLLAAWAVTATRQARQLVKERNQVRVEASRANRVRDVLLGLLTAAQPYDERATPVPAELLTVVSDQIHGTLDAEPEVQAELLGMLGEVVLSFGDYDRARDLIAESLDIQRRLHATDHPDLARAIRRYGRVLSTAGQWESAAEYVQDALAMVRRLYGDTHPEVAESQAQSAFLLQDLGRWRESEQAFRDAISLQRRLDVVDDEATATLWNGLGIVLLRLGQASDAEAVFERALAIRSPLFGPDHLATGTIYANLALALMPQGRFDEAERLYARVLEGRRRAFGEDHPRVATALHGIGTLLRYTGRLDEAEAHHRQALAIRRRLLPPGHQEIAVSLDALAGMADDRGDRDEAERLYAEALAMLRASVPDSHWLIGRTALHLGWLRLRRGRPAEAEPLLEEAGRIQSAAAGGGESIDRAEADVALGLLRAAQGRDGDARALIDPALARLRGYALADVGMLADAERVRASSR